MQVFEQKNSNKMYIYYVYIVKGVFFPFWSIHPMVILWFGSYMVLKRERAKAQRDKERERGESGASKRERRITGVKRRGAPKRPSVGSRKDAREITMRCGRAAMLLADYCSGSVVAYAILDDDELTVLDSLEGLDLVSGVVDGGSGYLPCGSY